MSRTGKDLTGQRFGKLSVSRFAGYSQNSRQRVSVWECQCDCGNTCVVQGYLLQNGRRKSCGCIRYSAKNLLGKRFGMLTVIRKDEDNHTTLQKVICRCDCGQEKMIAARDLKSGRITSCGCDKQQNRKNADYMERQYDDCLEEKRKLFQQGDFSEIHTLKDWVYIWLRDVVSNVVKSTTVRMYAETMEHHMLDSLGDRYLECITEQTVRDWVAGLQTMSISGTKNGTMTEGTVRNTLSVLSGCMRDAQKYGLIDRNPCLECAWTLTAKNVEEHQEWLDEEQVKRLEPILASYQDRTGYPVGIGFQLILYTGITLSEAAALRWGDIDFESAQLLLRYFVAVKREQPRESTERRYELERLAGRKKREVPVPDTLIKRLVQVRKEFCGQDEEFVLCKSKQEPVRMDRMRAALMRRADACGLGTVTPRMLRDTYAMRAVHVGATSDMIAELMGFASSQQVIRRYMPKNVVDKRELVKKMFDE